MACPRDFHYRFCVADWRALRPGSYPSSIEQKKSKGRGKLKGKEERSSTLPPAIYAPAAKGKTRSSFTPHLPSHYLLSGPTCHCGRSRLTSSPSSPLHLLTHMARLVIVAGSASFAPLHLFLSPSLLFIPTLHPHHSGPGCHCGRSRLVPSSLSLHLSLLYLHLLHPLYTILFRSPLAQDS